MTTATATAFDAAPDADALRRLTRLSRLARLMDTAVRVPGINVRFGLDSVIGLFPGVGDAAGGLIGLYIINEGRRLGLPKHKLLRMIGNLALDSAVGSIPLAGDVFDVYFKSHKRNANMILDHFGGVRADLDPGLIKDITPPKR